FAGVVIFLALFTIPFWYSQATGDANRKLDIKIAPEAGDECIESTGYMRSKHMDLLNDWRNEVVRQESRVYVSKNGTFDKSLTDTCLEQCHTNKAEFCDECHSYVAVQPDCWDCHNIVEE
ncbi:MAG: menaquinol oxidoreductase, partial [Chloroflexi bacterium]|nr:menaquinol oxidoreductase [Chloroflexota bacterium]